MNENIPEEMRMQLAESKQLAQEIGFAGKVVEHLDDVGDELLIADAGNEPRRAITIHQALGALWRPIETAPKDGTSILGYADGVQTTVRWCDFGYWELCVSGTGHLDDDEWRPTRWMPLLPQPTA